MSIDRDVCPQEAFQDDLSTVIIACQGRSESIILCIDLNEDTNRTNGPLQQTILRNNNLVDVMKHRHDTPTPPTHNRGSKTIDAIYMSPEMAAVENACWLRFGEGIGDHQIAYVDIPIHDIIGKERHEIARRSGQRLHTTNESSTKTYIKICERAFICKRMIERIQRLREQSYLLFDAEVESSINKIDKIRTDTTIQAERKCRKLRTGTVPYAPADIQNLGKEIRLWSLLIQRKGG